MVDFTIVTPSYNYGHYISECLESVAGQEGVTVEHLVMDADSTDDTAEVVGRFPHASFFREPDKGMSDGINKGFRKAQGNWVMWLNADDRLRPGALREVKEFVEDHPEADVVFGCWNFVDAEGDFLRRMTLFPFRKAMLENHLCYIASTSTFFRRATTVGEGYLLNERFKCVMDGEYLCRLAAEGKRFDYLPRVLADFRMHGQNTSQKHLAKTDVDGILALQLQLAERKAIHRMYGIRLFNDEMLNSVVEGFLHHVFRIQKGLLRWIHRNSCREVVPVAEPKGAD
ncbi:MAG: glycosyltransferase family 2 protein [Roseibacillus sp.]|nr:glycosyltransferase family 2 protein [Roseibacillus sp.]